MSRTDPPLPAASALAQHLYQTQHGWLQGWLQRRLGCPHQACDLMQDTFVRVLQSRHAAGVQEPRAFLATIARRVLFNFWRRRELEQAYLDALAAQPEPLALSAEDYAMVREAVEAIDRLLGALPPKVRRAFLLHRLEGLTHMEIGREMGLSVATVERYMRQALVHCCTAVSP